MIKQNSIGLAIGLIIALLMTGIAFYEKLEAQRYAKIVRVEELAAQSVSLRDTRFDLSLLLSVEAYHLADTPRTKGVLLDNVQANPQLVQYLHAEIGSPSSIAFSSDGKTLAAGYFGGEIILWDVATGTPKRHLFAKWSPSNELQAVLGDKNLGPVFSLMFTLDGKILISGIHTLYGDQRIIALWDTSTGRPISQPPLEKKSPYDLILSPNGKTLAISEWGKVSFWNMETNQFIGEVPVHPFEGLGGLNAMPVVSSPVFSPDGMALAVISSVNTITFWDVPTLKPVSQSFLLGDSYSRNGISHIMFGQDGKTLLAVNADGTLTSWNLETRQLVHRWSPLQVRDSYVLYGYGAAFSADAKLVAISDGSMIIVLDAHTGQQVNQPLKGNVNKIGYMTFTPDGKLLASVGGGVVTIWNLAGREPFAQIIGEHGGSSVAFSPDGKLLAADTFFDSNGWRLDVGLWEMTTRKFIGQLGSKGDYIYKPVAFSPNGKMLATGSRDGVALWDVMTRKLIDQFQLGTNNYLSSLAFSPDGKTLAAGNDLVVTLWDLANHNVSEQSLKASTGMVESIAFSPSGETLAVGDASDSIILWDVKSHDFIKWTASTDDVDSLVFSSNGKFLASTSRDGKIILWDVKSQQAIGRPFIVPTNAIPTTLAFSPDGKMIASGNYDNTINLWDVATRQPISQGLIGNDWPVSQVAFSPDGNSLASTSNKIILWDVNPQAWVKKICQRVGRNFTRTEWTQYFPEETYRATCSQWPLAPIAVPTIVTTP